MVNFDSVLVEASRLIVCVVFIVPIHMEFVKHNVHVMEVCQVSYISEN